MTLDIQKMAEQAGFELVYNFRGDDRTRTQLQAFANLVLEEAALKAEALPVPYGVGMLKEIHAHDMACVDCGRAIRSLKSPQDSATPTAPQQQRR